MYQHLELHNPNPAVSVSIRIRGGASSRAKHTKDFQKRKKEKIRPAIQL